MEIDKYAQLCQKQRIETDVKLAELRLEASTERYEWAKQLADPTLKKRETTHHAAIVASNAAEVAWEKTRLKSFNELYVL